MSDESTAITTGPTPAEAPPGEGRPVIHSLRELIDMVSGRIPWSGEPREDAGLAEIIPFPFLALVGQVEMKIALLLALINPAVSGVLLIGPRGTGKTTAVRSLLDLLPDVQRSTCFYGCTPEDIEMGGIDAVCPECAQKYGHGEPLTKNDRVRLVELPLNARLEDVIGGIDERAVDHERLRVKRGILAQADQNILYCDEINLLNDDIIDAILDASAQGSYTVRRGPVTATYRSRFILVGSMNPEEGFLRPQIMDRFGLRVIVSGLPEAEERLEAYQRVRAYRESPHRITAQYSYETCLARDEIQAARQLLRQVTIAPEISHQVIELTRRLQIDSLRAEITLFEAARAHAAADNRTDVSMADIRTVASLALRLRRSEFMVKYFDERKKEDKELFETLDKVVPIPQPAMETQNDDHTPPQA